MSDIARLGKLRPVDQDGSLIRLTTCGFFVASGLLLWGLYLVFLLSAPIYSAIMIGDILHEHAVAPSLAMLCGVSVSGIVCILYWGILRAVRWDVFVVTLFIAILMVDMCVAFSLSGFISASLDTGRLGTALVYLLVVCGAAAALLLPVIFQQVLRGAK